MKSTLKNTLFNLFFLTIPLGSLQARAAQIKTVFWSIPDLLYQNRGSMISKIGVFSSIWNAGTALRAQDTFFDALYAKLGTQAGPYMAYDPESKKPLPQIMLEWLLGVKSTDQVRREVRAALQTYDFPSGNSERDFIIKISNIVFTPAELASAMSLNNDTYSLLKAMAQRQKPRQILASNFDKFTFNELSQNNSDARRLFKYFNGIYISGVEGKIIQDPAFFNGILQSQGLNANESLVISSDQYVLNAAQSLGIKAIFYDGNYANLKAALKQLGLL